MKLKIKKLDKDAKIPNRSNPTDSGLDVYSNEINMIQPNEMKPIHTGIAIQLPKPLEIPVFPIELGVSFRQTIIWECQVRPRSGLAIKHQITIQNSPGTIDNDYRGEIIILLRNEGDKDFQVDRGMKIAQLVITPVIVPEIIEVEELNETKRGKDGFGSTGM